MLEGLDLQSVPSPCYVADLSLLRRNLRTLAVCSAETMATVAESFGWNLMANFVC